MNKGQFTLVDGLRGVAAIGVFALHSGKSLGTLWPASGYLAVDLFFLLSGMVIAYSYDQRIGDGALSPARFMTMRAIRFYPFYVMGAVLAVPVAFYSVYSGRAGHLHGPSDIFSAFALTLMFVPQRIGDAPPLFPLIQPYWSLFFELLVNAAFVLFWRWLTPRCLIAVILLSALALIWFSPGQGLHGGSSWDTFPMGMGRVSFSFFLGVLMVRHRPRTMVVSDGAASACLVALVVIMAVDPGAWRQAYDLFCVMLLFPMMALMGLRFRTGKVTGWLSGRLGDASYGVYAIHAPVTSILFGLLALAGLPVDGWAPLSFVAIALPLVGAVMLLDRHVDRPLRKWMNAIVAIRRVQRA